MSLNTNAWNRIRYTLATPIYNVVVEALEPDRKRAVQLLELQASEKVLIVGCGTGRDLDSISKGVEVVATDITPSMVAATKARAEKLGLGNSVDAQVMDGQKLELADGQFDVVILNLILAVLPDPYACIREVERVLKTGGRGVIFDKFLPAGQTPSPLRKAANVVTNTLFSDINRQLEPILAAASLLTITHREPASRLAVLNFGITTFSKR
jgi:phosphatidylethanolamine/phosphatidyl-N-methylethanolamine N-methyltransferase